MRVCIFVTGPPGIGKTTVLLKTAEKLIAKGYKLGGMVTQEIRERGIRVGFEIRDFASGKKGWLAHIHQPVGPRLGKYRVHLENLNSIGAIAIIAALRTADIVLVDEIGPMELFSQAFIDAVQKVINGSKSILASIHFRAQHSVVMQIKSRKDVIVIEVTPKNRIQLPTIITNEVIKTEKQTM
ncbi:MAG: NTPase [Candidatus Bathyarchaeota archaeon]|nr:MAG: NTPase [Candidatus Bathyarchaeota archaeon]